ncbi:TerD family protein [Rhodococcus zopfii]|uniref:TerD family protein n=1 Tax=Rhodococcus zopfii TaxID=43772 RepID=UPI000934DD80|nr:TerD family protein [Rhodococcus zopfii]
MSELTRGANTAIDGGRLALSVSGVRPGSVDPMAFRFDDSHRVRADDDFVFFNRPMSREDAVRLDSPGRITVDLNRIRPAIGKLTVAVALDDAAGRAHRFGLKWPPCSR